MAKVKKTMKMDAGWFDNVLGGKYEGWKEVKRDAGQVLLEKVVVRAGKLPVKKKPAKKPKAPARASKPKVPKGKKVRGK